MKYVGNCTSKIKNMKNLILMISGSKFKFSFPFHAIKFALKPELLKGEDIKLLSG
jgi:hypothetical protein